MAGLSIRNVYKTFGAVVYEMLAGERAFAGETTVAVLSAVLQGEPRPLSAPPGLERLVRRCLANFSASNGTNVNTFAFSANWS